MTNEEAIKYLKQLKYDYNPLCPQREALRLAIRALEEPNTCVLTMFGECSYKETGCSDCKVKNKIRKALETVDQAHNSLLNEEESERLLDFIDDDTGLHERAMSDLNDTVADMLRKCKRGDV